MLCDGGSPHAVNLVKKSIHNQLCTMKRPVDGGSEDVMMDIPRVADAVRHLTQVPVLTAMFRSNNLVLDNVKTMTVVCRRLRDAISPLMGMRYVLRVCDEDHLRQLANRFFTCRRVVWDSSQTISNDGFFKNLVELMFTSTFNQPIGVGTLPVSLQRLRLGESFNQPLVCGVLPPALIELDVGNMFNRPLGVGVLPSSLQKLTFGPLFDQPFIHGVLPTLLKKLQLLSFTQPLVVGALPPLLEELYLGDYDHPLRAGDLPPTLKKLTLDRFDQDIAVGDLPPSLLEITFLTNFNRPLGVNVLPSSLTKLVLSFYYDQPLDVGVLPSTLKTLVFWGPYFNQPIGVGVLPPSLKGLAFGEAFAQPLPPGVMPRSLKHLTFGCCFRQSFDCAALSSLKTLTYRCKCFRVSGYRAQQCHCEAQFCHVLAHVELPPSLVTLRVGHLTHSLR